MRRERLRPAWSPDQLATMYAVPHNHAGWTDHIRRVEVTIELARDLVSPDGVDRAADLSCGSGATLQAVPAREKYFGDLAPGYPITGPIEQTIEQIPDVGLFICTETIEHLDDPDAVLKAIAGKTRRLVLSTPIGAFGEANPEHYWAWDGEAIEAMLAGAGFRTVLYDELHVAYHFGIWGCRT